MKTLRLVFLMILTFAMAGNAFAQPKPITPKPATGGSASTGDQKLTTPMEIEKKAMNSLKSGKVLLNFEGADIKIVAKLMSELTGRNIVLDDKVSGKITVLSATEITPGEAWNLFKSALNSYGYDTINKGSYIKIVPRKESKGERTRFYSEANMAAAEDFLVAVVTLKNVDPNIITQVLKPFASEIGNVIAYPPSKSILISDEASNVKRLIKIAQHLDSKQQRQAVRTFKLKYAPSESVYKSLVDVYRPQEKGVFISDYSINNSIVVMASRTQLNDIEKIIEQMDKKPDSRDATRKFRVRYLQNANAEDVAKILSEMLKEGKSVEKATAVATAPTANTGGTPDAGGAPLSTSSGGTKSEKKDKSFVSTKVSSDEETNSLVMYLTDSEYEEIDELIAKLDTPRKQVFVSAIIAEVSLKRLQTTGANWQILSENGAGAAFGGGLSQEAIYQTLASGNFILGGMGDKSQTINISGRKVIYPDVFALLAFLNEDNDFNLLSAPRILTLDHKESKINVGSIMPFATGVKYDTNGQPIVTYDYKDVGLTLTVTPHVSQGKFVKMQVNQKIQDVTDYIQQKLGAVGYVVPVVSNREIDTNITVGDAQTIIIGGLVSKKTINAVKKVPILGDIPILGNAFKNSSKEKDKTTLFVFLTPHIIETPDKLIEITEKYQRFIEEKVPEKGQKVKDPLNEKRKAESKNTGNPEPSNVVDK
ncbi:MAG: type II secretion system secretin GspD [Firmicutes bacterium]|nr:type II secretion system secretin GspD [Bacillota bacterium]